MKSCPVCSENNWNDFYAPEFNRIMTGDQRIGDGKLEKVICNTCGVISNKKPFTHEELNVLYGKEYELNTLNREEHMFFTKEGPIARSQVFANWITPHIPQEAHEVTEIGCGEGQLLSKLKAHFPAKSWMGFDGSKKATELAKEKGLHVEQKLFLNTSDAPPTTDVILMINVIEHLENITDIIQVLRGAIRKNGRIIFCLPIQDFGGYDLFFAEHVWHFTTAQVIYMLEKCGLTIIHSDDNHPINHGIGLFVCEPKENNETTIQLPIANQHMENVLSNWKVNFTKINQLFSTNKHAKIAVFGSGEVFTLFYAFSALGNQNIVAVLDETPSKIGTKKHGIDIQHPDWLSENTVDLIFLAINSKYISLVKTKLEKYKTPIGYCS